MCSPVIRQLVSVFVIIGINMQMSLGQDMWDICVPNTTMTVNTTLYIVSPGYRNRIRYATMNCSCLIQAMPSSNATVYFTVRYVDWNVDRYTDSCWSTLNFKTYDSATNPEFCISDGIEIPLINRTLTRGLMVNFWREWTWGYKSGYFKLEISAAADAIQSGPMNLSVSCTNSYQTLPPLPTVSSTFSTTYASSASTTSQSRMTAPGSTTINLTSGMSTLLTSQGVRTYASTHVDDEKHTPAPTVTNMSTAMIIAITVGSIGCATFIIIILIVIICCCKKQRQIVSSYEKQEHTMQTFTNSIHNDNDVEDGPMYEDAELGSNVQHIDGVDSDPTYECAASRIPVRNDYELETDPASDCYASTTRVPNSYDMEYASTTRVHNSYDMESSPTYELAGFSGVETSPNCTNKNHDGCNELLQLDRTKKTSLSSVGSQYADMNRGSVKAISPLADSSNPLKKLNVTSMPKNDLQDIVKSPTAIAEETVPLEHTYNNVQSDSVRENSEISGNDCNIYINSPQVPLTDLDSAAVYSFVNNVPNDTTVALRELDCESQDEVESMTRNDDDMVLVENSIYVSQ